MCYHLPLSIIDFWITGLVASVWKLVHNNTLTRHSLIILTLSPTSYDIENGIPLPIKTNCLSYSLLHHHHQRAT